MFDTDEGEFKAFLRGLSSDFVNLTEKELKEAAIPILVQERPKSTYSDKKFIEPEKGMTEYQRRRLALAGAKGGADEESTYRQQIVAGIMKNDKGSIDEMKAYLPSGSKVNYLTSQPTKTAKGQYNFIRVNIPAVLDVDGTIKKPGIVEDISLSLGDPKNRLNAILSEYIGEGVSPSKFNIRGGKPRGEQIEIKGQEKTNKPTTSNIATPKSFVYSATSGNNKVYSNDGKTWYTKDGKKIQ